MTLALAETHQNLWWIALGAGAVVLVVVGLMLGLLLRFVRQIDDDVQRLWETGTVLASNTATAWMVTETATLVGQLREEVEARAAAGEG